MKVFRDVKFAYRRVNLKESSIVNEILKLAAEEEYDAVIVGSKGNSMNEARLIGSTALSLVLEFPATVIVVR
jgi:nucleotide-binding universal stress UspA family protein